jgi:serine protease Do
MEATSPALSTCLEGKTVDEKVVSDRSERTHGKLLWITALGVLSVVFGTLVWANPDTTAPLEETALIQLFERASPAVVAVVAKRSSPQATGAGHESRGSGFFIDREGHLLTTAHFLYKASHITATLDANRAVSAKVIGLDPALNVALLKADPPAESVFIPPLGDSSHVRVGQRAILIGNPMGLNQIMGVGVVSGISPLLGTRTSLDRELVFETDIAVKSPQLTGSPVFNRQGEVIGISNVIIDDTRNLSFVLPINLVKEILSELTASGWVARPSLGVRGQIIGDTDQALQLFKLPLVPGFLVEQVEEGSPAALAGLRGGTLEVVVSGNKFLLGGDIITAINGHRIRTGADFTQATAQLRAGEAVTITVFRRGEEVDLGIRVAALPE